MSLKKNIIANYIGTGTVALAPILALPWYLAALGPKQFGLVSFLVMLQALLSLLDAGLSQALVREVAVRLNLPNLGRNAAAKLIFGFERLYWLFSISIAVIIVLLGDYIVHGWLRLDELSAGLGFQAVIGAAGIFAVQFPGLIYRSFLIGAQEQVVLNKTMVVCAIVRHLGCVLILMLWPTLMAYIVWHGLISLLETCWRAQLVWRILGCRATGHGSLSSLRPIWSLVIGLSAATLLGALTVQMDRLILSQMVSLQEFGYYSIAASIAIGALQLVHPLTQGVLPQAIQVRENPNALRKINIRLLGAISLLVGVSGLIYFLTGKWLLGVWLRNVEAEMAVYPVLTILLIGTALNAFYNVGYLNWIARNNIRRVLQVNLIAFMLSVALIPLFVSWFGAIGASFGWLTINLIGFLMSLEWLMRRKPSEIAMVSSSEVEIQGVAEIKRKRNE